MKFAHKLNIIINIALFITLTAFLGFGVDVLKQVFIVSGAEELIKNLFSDKYKYGIFVVWLLCLSILIGFSFNRIKKIKVKEYKKLEKEDIANNEILVLGISDNNSEILNKHIYENGILRLEVNNENHWFILFENINKIINDYNNNLIKINDEDKERKSEITIQNKIDNLIKEKIKIFAKNINFYLDSNLESNMSNFFTHKNSLENKNSFSEILNKHNLILSNKYNRENYVRFFSKVIKKDIMNIILILKNTPKTYLSITEIKKEKIKEISVLKSIEDKIFENKLSEFGTNFKLRFPLSLTNHFLTNKSKEIIVFGTEKSKENFDLYKEIVKDMFKKVNPEKELKITFKEIKDITNPVSLLDNIQGVFKNKKNIKKVLIDVTPLTKTYSIVMSSVADSYGFERVYIDSNKNDDNNKITYHYWKMEEKLPFNNNFLNNDN